MMYLCCRDSLEKFAAAASDGSRESSDDASSDKERTNQPSLFQFRSPPKAAANKNINRLRANGHVTHDNNTVNGVRKQLQPHLDGAESEPRPPDKPSGDKTRNHRNTRPAELPVYNSVYNPSAYKQSDTDSKPDNHKPDTKPPHHLLEPRPPDSPRPGSRPGSQPGSGRLRSRGGSRTSNHSNKPTPESSGTGEELSKQLQNGHQVPDPAELSPRVSNRIELASRRILKQGDELPSPRASHMEPRISSAGRRPGSGSARGSKPGSSESSREDQLEMLPPPHIQQLRMSDRVPSPLSSRGSTRLSRKSLREIPDTDERLINAQPSSSPVSYHFST